jgi:alpha-tubulin suppressor-like RCC1 family protein
MRTVSAVSVIACVLAGCGGGASGPHLPELTGVSSLSLSSTHACALVEGGRAHCWGEDVFGQLGDGQTLVSVPSATEVPNISGLTAVVAGGGYTCGLVGDGAVACWGNDLWDQIGDAPTDSDASAPATRHLSVPAPTAVMGLGPIVTALASPGDSPAGEYTCALMSDGSVQCWGENTLGLAAPDALSMPPTEIPGLAHVHAMALGDDFGCFALDDGSVSCLGVGPLGQPDRIATNAPTPVSGLANVQSLAAGEFHVCALIEDGTVSCWGIDASNMVPAAVSGLSGVLFLAAGGYETCAVLRDGSVSCWREDSGGPKPVSGLAGPAASVAVASDVACAVLRTGRVQCWGTDKDGRLGDGVPPDGTPRVVTKPVTVVSGDGGV